MIGITLDFTIYPFCPINSSKSSVPVDGAYKNSKFLSATKSFAAIALLSLSKLPCEFLLAKSIPKTLSVFLRLSSISIEPTSPFGPCGPCGPGGPTNSPASSFSWILLINSWTSSCKSKREI